MPSEKLAPCMCDQLCVNMHQWGSVDAVVGVSLLGEERRLK